LEIKLSDLEAEDSMLKGNYLWQVVAIVIGAVPTVLENQFICLFMSLGRILLQGSILTNLFDPMRHQVDLLEVEVSLELLGNINLMADIMLPSLRFALLLGRHPSFSICFLIYHLHLQKFRS
jgi:hypothetical protein